jgi:hypothetical protein
VSLEYEVSMVRMPLLPAIHDTYPHTVQYMCSGFGVQYCRKCITMHAGFDEGFMNEGFTLKLRQTGETPSKSQ